MAGISKKNRFDVFKRDGFKCQYCGRTPPQVVLELDHVIPRSKGGTDHQTNLVTACFDCNRGKATGDLQAVPQSICEQVERQRELVAQTKAYHRHVNRLRQQEDQTIDALGRYWCNQLTKTKKADKYTWDKTRKRSGRLFLWRLPLDEVYEAIDIAFGRKPAHSLHRDEDTWKYFCGICWNKIREGGGG